MAKPAADKKKHHVIPVTYLRNFGNSNGKVFAFFKDKPAHTIHVPAKCLAIRDRYYSQPTSDGSVDHNKIESFFDKEVERHWTPLLQTIRKQGHLDERQLEALFTFIITLRVRVPAARDMAEAILANGIRMTAQQMDRMGKLPPRPAGFEDILETMQIAIDPHQSIAAMPNMMEGMGKLLGQISFKVFRNQTNLPLLTSDNPVIYFDPSVPEGKVRPYLLPRDLSSVEFMFPIDPDHLMHGHSDYDRNTAITYGRISNVRDIRRANRFIARFGYEVVFGSLEGQQSIVRKYAHESPVPSFKIIPTGDSSYLFSEMVFGSRVKKPKWTKK